MTFGTVLLYICNTMAALGLLTELAQVTIPYFHHNNKWVRMMAIVSTISLRNNHGWGVGTAFALVFGFVFHAFGLQWMAFCSVASAIVWIIGKIVIQTDWAYRRIDKHVFAE